MRLADFGLNCNAGLDVVRPQLLGQRCSSRLDLAQGLVVEKVAWRVAWIMVNTSQDQRQTATPITHGGAANVSISFRQSNCHVEQPLVGHVADIAEGISGDGDTSACTPANQVRS
jgi:hypothetical protein